MKLAVLLIGSGVLIASAVPSFAHDGYAGRDIDARQDGQYDRIDRARRSGELTGREYRTLMSEQHRITDMERRATADGALTWRERAGIRNAQREAERHIYRDTHDREVSWWRRWRWY